MKHYSSIAPHIHSFLFDNNRLKTVLFSIKLAINLVTLFERPKNLHKSILLFGDGMPIKFRNVSNIFYYADFFPDSLNSLLQQLPKRVSAVGHAVLYYEYLKIQTKNNEYLFSILIF